MEGDFELSWAQKVTIHENSIMAATEKLYMAQQEKATWGAVKSRTKPGDAEHKRAENEVQLQGLTILYCQTAIEHHRRKLAEARKMLPPDEAESPEDEPAIVAFPGSADRAAGAAD